MKAYSENVYTTNVTFTSAHIYEQLEHAIQRACNAILEVHPFSVTLSKLQIIKNIVKRLIIYIY